MNHSVHPSPVLHGWKSPEPSCQYISKPFESSLESLSRQGSHPLQTFVESCTEADNNRPFFEHPKALRPLLH